MKLRTTIFLCCMLILCTFTAQAGGRYFVDLDGDGFNDNIIDVDNNNIPDEFQTKVKEIRTHTRTFSFSPTTLLSNKSKETKLTVSQQFSLHQFKARMLTKCRSNFDSDFNSGLSMSTSSSGGCVGGICF